MVECAEVGRSVGFLEGLNEGLELFIVMGFALGDKVGSLVLMADGKLVGTPVGLLEGAVEPKTVGFALGFALGDAVGTPVGLLEGTSEPKTVGFALGVGLGDEVGLFVVPLESPPPHAQHATFAVVPRFRYSLPKSLHLVSTA